MTGPLTYLWWRSSVTRLRRKSAQVRNPRYALALVAGVAYMWYFLARRAPVAGAPPAGIEALAALGAALAIAWSWTLGRTPAGFVFSPAEVTFLFTAPVTRRRLIEGKLARAQLLVLRYTLLWTVILSRSPWDGRTALRALAVWIALSTLYLHRVGASLVRGELRSRGPAEWRRHPVVLPLVALGIALLGVTLVAMLRSAAVARADGAMAMLDAVGLVAKSGPAAWLLAPFRALIAPILHPSTTGWVRAAAPGLAMLLVHWVWVVRSDATFEEAAAADADAQLRRNGGPASAGTAPVRATAAGRPLFRLAPAGPPAVAILWKNLLAVTRAGGARRLALLTLGAALVIAIASARSASPVPTTLGILAGTWALLAVIVGPQWVRNDLRSDLPRLELLRSYPLTGFQIVGAEVAASTLVLTAGQYALMLVAYCGFLGSEDGGTTLATRTLALIAAVLVLPAMNYLGLLLQNGAALLFPAWVHLGPRRAGGVEALGQNTLAMAFYALALAVALLPAAALAGAAAWLLWSAAGAWSLLPAGAIGVGVVIAESRLLLVRLGRVFERIDITEAGLQRP